jgi:hypothetical protein
LKATERLLYEKNKDEELQNLIRHSGGLFLKGPISSTDKISMFAENMRILIVELLRSSDFRELAGESLSLFGDILSERSNTMYCISNEVWDSQLIPQAAPTESESEGYIKSVFEVKNIGPNATSEGPYVEHTVIKERPLFSTAIPNTCPYEQQSGTANELPSTPYYSYFQTINYNPDYYTTEEREIREAFVERYLQLLKKISQNQEFHNALSRLFNLFDTFNETLFHLKDPNAKPFEGRDNVQKSITDARKLLENFTGKQEMGLFRKHLNSLYEDVYTDEELSNWFRQIRVFSSEAIRNPQILDYSQKQLEGRLLIYQGIDLLHSEEWLFRFRQINDDLKMLLDNIRNDAVASDFTQKMQKFLKDFSFNPQGRPDLWVIDESLHQLRLILIPMLRAHLENIPIDKIELISKKYNVILEDLVFSGADILPDNLELKLRNKMKLNLQEAEKDVQTHKLKLTVTHIKPTVKNLKFYYKKKHGFPKMEDYGVADVALTGEGMSIKILWKLISKRGMPTRVELDTTKCSIGGLRIHFIKEKTKHDLLDRIFVKFLNNTIKRKIANAVAEYLQLKVTEVDLQINQFFANRPFQSLKGKDVSYEEFTKTTKEVEKIPGQTTKKITEEEAVLVPNPVAEAPLTSASQTTGFSAPKKVQIEETKSTV